MKKGHHDQPKHYFLKIQRQLSPIAEELWRHLFLVCIHTHQIEVLVGTILDSFFFTSRTNSYGRFFFQTIFGSRFCCTRAAPSIQTTGNPITYHPPEFSQHKNKGAYVVSARFPFEKLQISNAFSGGSNGKKTGSFAKNFVADT